MSPERQFRLSQNPLDRIGQFDDIVDEASHSGYVVEMPKSKVETFDYESQKVRLQAISERLYLLGYLEGQIPHSKLKSNLTLLKDAVNLFQKEAGLKVDEWVGDKTWYALEELVGFESKLSDDWFEGEGLKATKSKALHRSIQLRMWSLGMYRNRPKYNFRPLKPSALKNFKIILKALAIANAQVVGLNKTTCRILFNQDFIVKRISLRNHDSRETVFRFNLTREEYLRNESLLNKFLVSVAKVELWLLGCESRINGRNDFVPNRNNQLYKNLVFFYSKYLGYPSAKAKRYSRKLRPSFFKEISSESDYTLASKIPVEEVEDYIKQGHKFQVAWSYIKEQGARLWDGVKRIWRWVLRKGKQALLFIKENLFKSFFRYVQKSYKILKVGIREIVGSIGNYIKGGITFDKNIVVYQADMDSFQVLGKDSSSESLRRMSLKLQKNGKAFAIGCQIVGWVVKTLLSIISGVFGWVDFLISLLRSYKDLFVFYEKFKSLSI